LDALLAIARENDDSDPVLRHAAAMGLAGTQSPKVLVAASNGKTPAERMAIAIALGRQQSPLIATFLRDDNPRIALEAARFIWDTPIPEAFDELAGLIVTLPTNDPLVRRVLAANLAQRDEKSLRATI